MSSDNKVKIILNTMILTMFSLLLSLSGCPEEPENHDDDQLDTTSHNFTWEIDTLGHYGSYLNDIWIVNENNIWVVGNIKTDSGEYNAARWNGIQWKMLGIYSNTLDLYSIFFFSENDIWVTDYCSPIHWDGQNWILYHIQNLSIDACAGLKIWGISSSNIYFVGDYGSIVHFDGSTFTKMPSGTDTPIIDICGTDANHIWATAISNQLDNEHPNGYESVTLFCDGNTWTRKYTATADHCSDYSETNIAGYMTSVWANEATVYISSHSGLWKESIKKGKGQLMHGPDNRLNGYPFLVRGTGYNDVYAFTHWGEFLHFNGKTWNRNLELDGINVMGASVTKDMVVTVGDMQFRYIIIVRGHHVK